MFQVNPLLGRGFTWKIKTYFLRKISKKFKCRLQLFLFGALSYLKYAWLVLLSWAWVISEQESATEHRAATYHPLQNSLTFPWFFPDILQFSIPSDKSKKIFLFFTLMVSTVSLQIWGFLLKERICSLGGVSLKGKNLLPKGANSYL